MQLLEASIVSVQGQAVKRFTATTTDLSEVPVNSKCKKYGLMSELSIAFRVSYFVQEVLNKIDNRSVFV